MELVINDRIRNRKVEFFNDFSMNLKYDSVGSTFGISFYFDPDNNEHKELMCIGHYHQCKLTHLGETLITGNILSQGFTDTSTRNMVSLAGYSLGGVLSDSNIPPDLYPLQSQGLSLKQIAEKLLSKFNLKLIVDSEVSSEANKVFPDSTAEASGTIAGYLSSLATQRGIILSHDTDGNILLTKAKTNKQPILNFDSETGSTVPNTSMKLTFDGQAMHSHITVMKEADDSGGNAGEYTIRNPFVINSVYRPKIIKQSSGDDNDSQKAAILALAEELKGIKLVIELDRWDIKNNGIIRPNNTVSVKNKNVYLYKETKWFIEEISYTGDVTQPKCTLTCVLPEVYNGNVPEYIWKGINLH